MSNPTWWDDFFTVLSKWIGSSSIICVGLMINYEESLKIPTGGWSTPPAHFWGKLLHSLLYTFFDLFIFASYSLASLTDKTSRHDLSTFHPNGDLLSTGTIIFLIGLFAYIFLYIRSDEAQRYFSIHK